jgi:hypothetical protein
VYWSYVAFVMYQKEYDILARGGVSSDPSVSGPVGTDRETTTQLSNNKLYVHLSQKRDQSLRLHLETEYEGEKRMRNVTGRTRLYIMHELVDF